MYWNVGCVDCGLWIVHSLCSSPLLAWLVQLASCKHKKILNEKCSYYSHKFESCKSFLSTCYNCYHSFTHWYCTPCNTIETLVEPLELGG